MPVPAAARPASPEQLDLMLRVSPSLAWPALALLAGALLAGFVSSVFVTAPVRAEAQGVLLNPGGITDIPAPAQGRLTRLMVSLNSTVEVGQQIAEIDQPELLADLTRHQVERDNLLQRRDRLQKLVVREAAARIAYADVRRTGLNKRIAVLSTLEVTIQNLLSVQQTLLPQGLTTQDRLLNLSRQLEETQTQHISAEQELAEIVNEATSAEIKAMRELLDNEMALAGTLREIAWNETELDRRKAVLSPVAGRVVDLVMNRGEMTSIGQPVARIERDSDRKLVAVLFVAPKSSRPVQIGMRAQIIPATVRVLRDGYIEGTVTSISPLPATPESMHRLLKNSKLVEQLSDNGAPVEVTVQLAADPATPSGYHWSDGIGPKLQLGDGTLTNGRIVTDRIPLLALVIPQFEYVLGKLGI